MKMLLMISLVLAMLLASCSMPVDLTSPSLTGQTTYNPDTDLGFSQASSYAELIQLYLDAKANQNFAYGYPKTAVMDAAAESSAGDSNSQGASDDSYSSTNVQIEGVDEADIIKTDGDYLYLIANERLYIVDIQDPAAMAVVSTYRLFSNRKVGESSTGETPIEMYVDADNNRLVLISSGWLQENIEDTMRPVDSGMTSDSKTDVAAESIVYNYSYKQFTTTRVFDISNRSNPKVTRQFSQTGYYLDSRKIGLALYVITNEYGGYYYAARDLAETQTLLPEDVFPSTSSKIGTLNNDDFETVPADRISILPKGDVENKLVIAGIDVINSEREPDLLSVLGTSGTVFCSKNYLYVASYNYPWLWAMADDAVETDDDASPSEDVTTDIYRFKLADTMVSEAGKGSVPGWIVNQFSMDEYDGTFRIATTVGSTWSRSDEDKATNNVYVLDSKMEIIGRVTGLAPGESIKSVRFMGETAYVVTFRDVDPLFVIDLSNPQKPVVLGQLKIPGYSTYLHPYKNDGLIGFGYDVIVKDGNAYNAGVKVSLFDIADFNNPVETSTMVLGGRGSFSPLLYDHKALIYSEARNLIAFPVSLTEKTSSALSYGQPIFTGLVALSIEGDQLVRTGSITHFDKLTDPDGGYVPLTETEYHAFFSYDAIFRGAYAGDTLFTLSNREVRSTDMTSFEFIGSVSLPGFEEFTKYNSEYAEEPIEDIDSEPTVEGSEEAPDESDSAAGTAETTVPAA